MKLKRLRIEILRTGGRRAVLEEWRQYIRVVGDRPAVTFNCPVGEAELRRLLVRLRPRRGGMDQADVERAERALVEMGEIAADAVPALERTGGAAVEIDLVLNSAEMAAIPFEAVCVHGVPVFADKTAVAVPIRQVRVRSERAVRPWPARPRVLFAWSQPDGEVPFKRHRGALQAALSDWSETPPGSTRTRLPPSVFVECADAELGDIERALADAEAEGRPFTHVHLLAHGGSIAGEYAGGERFGLALVDGVVGAETLTSALVERRASPPFLISLASCDSGNAGLPFVPGASLAQALHEAGTPVVVGSQYPLTFTGSVTLTRELYGRVLRGEDVRGALHEARVELHGERKKTMWDWVGMVAYARLPADYAEDLVRARLQIALDAMGRAQRWVDELALEGGSEALVLVYERLLERRDSLDQVLTSTALRPSFEDVRVENLGLIGSAEKRLAEAAFVLARQGDDEPWRSRSEAHLEAARQWYGRAHDSHTHHHWSAVQYLALTAVLTGSLVGERERWMCAAFSAGKDERSWAAGSLAELYLLAPLVGEHRPVEDIVAQLARVADDLGVLTATRRQLGRYTTWWTAEQGLGRAPAVLQERARHALEQAASRTPAAS